MQFKKNEPPRKYAYLLPISKLHFNHYLAFSVHDTKLFSPVYAKL